MTRALTPAVEAELEAAGVRPIRLFFADFTTPWRTWTGYGTLSWAGAEWLGLGDLLEVGPSQETVDTGAEALELVLAGVDPARVSLALQEPYQGRDVEIWFGFLDREGQLIPEPYLEYAGTADLLSHSEDGQGAVLTLAVETAWADTEPSRLRYSHAAQTALHPGDLFFEFAAQHSIRPTEWLVKQ